MPVQQELALMKNESDGVKFRLDDFSAMCKMSAHALFKVVFQLTAPFFARKKKGQDQMALPLLRPWRRAGTIVSSVTTNGYLSPRAFSSRFGEKAYQHV